MVVTAFLLAGMWLGFAFFYRNRHPVLFAAAIVNVNIWIAAATIVRAVCG